MKSFIKVIAIAAVLAAPVASFAQSSNQPLTRAEVRNQLIQLERAGYNPGQSNDTNYPSDIQAAEARVQAQNPAVAQTQEPAANTSGYGGVVNGSSQSGGVSQPMSGPKSVYFGN
jgi:type II secretory pathway pseudopilin PulG